MTTAERVGLDAEFVGSFRNDSLHLILLPTEQCNFRCTYCYEDFEIGAMSEPVIQGVERLVESRFPELRRLNLSWFGGEPLLAPGVIDRISRRVKHLLEGRGDECTYVADITTNGYLLNRSRASTLVENGVRHVQVSLDGPSELHDTTRVRADGGRTFDRVWQNLEALRSSDLQLDVLLRVHVTESSLPAMPGFLESVRRAFLGDDRFRVMIKAVERLGGANDAVLPVLGGDRKDAAVASLEEVVSSSGDLASRRDDVYRGDDFCYAARANSYVVRADGVVGKCTVALNDPRNAVGRLRPDGTIAFDPARVRPWLRGWASGNEDELRCPYGGMGPDAPRDLPLLELRSPARRDDRPPGSR